jgi:hypothetical protein
MMDHTDHTSSNNFRLHVRLSPTFTEIYFRPNVGLSPTVLKLQKQQQKSERNKQVEEKKRQERHEEKEMEINTEEQC